MNSQFLQQIKHFLNRFTFGQKIILLFITAAALSCLIFLVIWASRPEFGLLYSNLDASDAAAIVDNLRSNNIPYKLKDNGSTILVPSKDIYELRIQYAGQKLISRGAVGYELFDKNNFGMTDFMQKLNLRRALEGELSKTINEIESIEQSRVHLVIPEPALFEEESKPATASVIVKLYANGRLNHKQIAGISHMVAGSVEGLSPENVTILDTQGNILTDKVAGNDLLGLSSSQFELKQKVENYLGEKAQSMLDEVLGRGNAIVKVAAELNFKKVRRTTESFDPDNTVVLSEERNEESSSREDTTLYQRENVVTNYELNKTTEEFENSVGDIERLSIAVFVNGASQVAAAGAAGAQQASSYSDEQIEKIGEIVKHAVGFDSQRSDKIVVQQVGFNHAFLTEETDAIDEIAKKEFLLELLRIGLIVVGVIAALLFLRRFYKKLGGDEFMKLQTSRLLNNPEAINERLIGQVGEDLTDDIYLKKLSPEAQVKLKMNEEIAKEVKAFAENEPSQATNLIRYWLTEDE